MIYITYDIDWLHPWHPYSIVKWSLPSSRWLTWKQLFKRDVFLTKLKEVVCENEQANLTPIYHIGVPHTTVGRYDMRYRAFSPVWNEAIDIVKMQEVGLHSHTKLPIAQQLAPLETAIAKPVRFHRSHYLQHNRTQLQLELFHTSVTHDFTTGTIRHLTNTMAEHQGSVHYIPTVLFDNLFFVESPVAVFDRFKRLLETVAVQHSPIAIAFHPENQLLMPVLQEHYHSVLQIIQQAGIPFFHSS